MNYVISNQTIVVKKIFVGTEVKKMVDIAPEAIKSDGYLIENPWVENRRNRKERSKIVRASKPKTAPMVLWTVTEVCPRGDRVRLSSESLDGAFTVATPQFKHEPNRNKKSEMVHKARFLVVLPRGASIRVYIEVNEGEKQILAELINLDGTPEVTMYEQPEMMAALAEVEQALAA